MNLAGEDRNLRLDKAVVFRDQVSVLDGGQVLPGFQLVLRVVCASRSAGPIGRGRIGTAAVLNGNPSRSDLMNLAVGFNPRWDFRRDAVVA